MLSRIHFRSRAFSYNQGAGYHESEIPGARSGAYPDRFFGQDYRSWASAGCQTWDNTTNDSSITWVQPIGVPVENYLERIEWTRTNMEYVLPPEIFGPLGVTGTCTYVLSEEYTDDELRANILAWMPPYPQDWYTPSGGWYDHHVFPARRDGDGDLQRAAA